MKRVDWLPLALGTLAAFGFCGCTEDSTAGRGIWDETENSLAIRIRNEAGNPVVGAELRLVGGTDVILAKAETDSEGTARLNRLECAGHVEVTSAEGVARSAFSPSDTALSETVRAAAVLSGRIPSASGVPRELYLYGTSYKASVGEDGSFRFENIPEGEYAVLSGEDDSFEWWDSFRLTSGEEAVVSVDAPSKDSVLLEDFESGRSTNRFHSLTGGGWWFTFWQSFAISSELPEKGHEENAWNGTRSLHERFTLDTLLENPYALVGFNIGSPPSVDSVFGYDVSGMDSLTFFAKGFGRVWIQFAGYTPEAKSEIWDFEFDIPSDSAWTRITVVPDGGELWNSIAAEMKTVNFLVKEDAELWLDQIVIHGVSASEIFHRELAR